MQRSRFWSRIRRLARETLVIMVGVLIALIVQHYYSEWRDGVRVQDVRSAMHVELTAVALAVRSREQALDCADDRLDEIEALVAAGGAVTIANESIGQPTFRISPLGAFAGASPDQLRRHMSADEVRQYGELYQNAAVFTELGWREREAWVVLGTFQGRVASLSPDRSGRYREAIASARDLNGRMRNLTRVMVAAFQPLGVPAPASRSSSNDALCQPLRISRG